MCFSVVVEGLKTGGRVGLSMTREAALLARRSGLPPLLLRYEANLKRFLETFFLKALEASSSPYFTSSHSNAIGHIQGRKMCYLYIQSLRTGGAISLAAHSTAEWSQTIFC
jgi:chromosome condensin MukBEF MukE localization factor